MDSISDMSITQPVYIGLGSNIDRERYILAGVIALSEQFGEIALSSVYESDAYGFNGAPFYNLVARLESAMAIDQLATLLKQIEYRVAGECKGARFRDRRLDMDLLLYAQLSRRYGSRQVPRADVIQHEYVLRPLAELAPNEKYPLTNQTYRQLLARLFPTINIKVVPFCWPGAVAIKRPYYRLTNSNQKLNLDRVLK